MPELVKDFINKINGLEKDIKQFKRVAEEFDKTQNFLESIYDGTNTAIFVVDRKENNEFIYSGLNPCYEKLTGLKSNWINGKCIEDLESKVSKDTCRTIKKKIFSLY